MIGKLIFNFKGAVILFIAVPFLFLNTLICQELCKINLSIKENKPGKELFFNDNFLKYNPESNMPDSGKTDTNMTYVKPKDITLKKFKMKKSPTTAVLLSAVIPGAGQFYNESYWKIPIISGLVGYFGYEYFRNNNLYKDYRDQYAASQNDTVPDGNLNLKSLREFYRNQRDDFVWYFLIVYVVNLVDAYVDAHLFDFDVRDDKFVKNGTRGKEYRLKLNLKL